MLIRGLTVKGIEVRSTSSAISSDEYFNLVSLLLPGTGTNGAQNNTFQDGSTNHFTVTRAGNTTQGTFSPFSQTGWGNFFNGSSRLDVATSAAFATGTGSFTVEAWVYVISGTINGFLSSWTNNTGNGFSIGGYTSGSDYLINFSIGTGASANVALSSAITLNTWHHVAGVRDGSTMTLYIDGVAVSTTSTSRSIDRTVCSIGSIYGADVGGGYYLNGYVSNVRFVSSAVYTSNFTPSTSPLTAIANTQLLTAQSNRFVDNSGNSRAITVGTGSPSVQAFAPFDPTTAYSAGTVGGSEYFDGTGDYLSVASNAALGVGSGDFTLECWVYLTANFDATGQGIITAAYDTNFALIGVNTGAGNKIDFYVVNTLLSTGTNYISLNTWTHIAAVRSSGTTKIYFDGVEKASSGSLTGTGAAATLYIGTLSHTLTQEMTGYISSARLVKGSAVYTSAFTPPTAPVTAIANTSLLLNFTNGGIIDATAKNVLETVGSAQISTTRSKFGSSSIYLSSANDYLRIPPSRLFAVFAGDFTVECWVNYAAVILDYTFIFTTYDGTNELTFRTGNSGFGYVVQAVLGVGAGAVYTSSYTISDLQNVWTHLAFCRTGTTTRFFYNGVEQSSKTSSVSLGVPIAGYPTVGVSGGYSATAYIQDLRFTKGLGRYTANFTPPTQAFPTQ
jgi:hypothetical protein